MQRAKQPKDDKRPNMDYLNYARTQIDNSPVPDETGQETLHKTLDDNEKRLANLFKEFDNKQTPKRLERMRHKFPTHQDSASRPPKIPDQPNPPQ